MDGHYVTMLLLKSVAAIVVLLGGSGCFSEAPGPVEEGPPRWLFLFSVDYEGWEGFAAQYSEAVRRTFSPDIRHVHAQEEGRYCCPAIELRGRGSSQRSLLLRYRLSGLDQNAEYEGHISFDVLSNVPNDCVGVGGRPGEDVTFHGAFLNYKPQAELIEPGGSDSGYWELNVNPEDVQLLGDFANGQDCAAVGTRGDWVRKRVESPDAQQFQSDSNGKAWVMIAVRLQPISYYRVPFDWIELVVEPAGPPG